MADFVAAALLPYGAQRGGGEVDTPYRYTGQRWEESDALDIYYYKARWYDPALGRFLQPDTIVPSAANPQSLNRYSYVLNNPVKLSDPTGHYTYRRPPTIHGSTPIARSARHTTGRILNTAIQAYLMTSR